MCVGRRPVRLAPQPAGRTRITWDERLRFPWLGGPVAGLVAAPVLRLMWRGNLRRLASLVENRAHG